MSVSEPSIGDAALTSSAADAPRRHLSVTYVVMVAVAMVVGAGIFRSPAEIAANAGSASWMFAAWFAGGVISLLGALCYAELAAAFPSAGGDYHFLKTAFGRHIAFLFAWARFAVINTGSIALLGFVLGDYANHVYSLGELGASWYALLAVFAMTLFNLKGLYTGASADYTMTGLEVGGLLLVFAAGVAMVATGAPPLHADPAPVIGIPITIGQAMLFVMFAFMGWNEVATMSAEVRDSARGMVRALVTAILVITLLYMLANWAMWRGLGLTGLAQSSAPAAEVIEVAFGDYAGLLTALAIAMATITSINATIVVGARTTYAAAADWPRLQTIGQWDRARGIPTRAILAQSAVAVLLIGFGTWTREGFATLVDYSSPVFWTFLTLSGIAVFVLRKTHPDTPRPFKVPLYPLTPLVFIAASVFVLWSSIAYVRVGALVGLGVLALGGIAMLWLARDTPPAAAAGGR